MKSYLLAILLFFVSHAFFAQTFNHKSAYTYVYKPNRSEVEKILKKGYDKINLEMLHTLVDSFPTTSNYKDELSSGQYLLTRVNDRFFDIQFVQIHRYTPYVHGSLNEVKIELTDTSGTKVSDALVTLNHRHLKFNIKRGCYISNNTGNGSLLVVEKDGIVDYFYIDKNRLNSGFRWNRIHHTAPIRFVWYPFRDIYYSFAYGSPSGWIRRVTNPFLNPISKFDGYVAFSKPKYKPGDTIKVKAFVTNKKGKPIKKPLEVFLSHNYKKSKLTTLDPYRPGGYEYQFKIPDSLNIKLDKSNSLVFQKGKNQITGYFKYSEYELTETTFSLKSSQEKHARNRDLEIELSAKDENGLVATGVSAQIKITPQFVYDIDSIVKSIPQVIFQDTIFLSAEKATKYYISDTLFHGMDLQYEIEVLFGDADGRTKTKRQLINYHDDPFELQMSVKGDSIFIESTNGEEIRKVEAQVELEFENSQSVIKKVQLPYSEKINQYSSAYWAQTDQSSDYLSLESIDDEVSCSCYRSIDSIYFYINNTRKLEINYEIYKMNKEVLSGISKSNFNHSIGNNKNSYFLRLSYIWGGQVQKKDCRSDFYEKILNVSIEAPSFIVPGQEVEFKVSVKDIHGRPVSNVDLTGIGYTQKLKGTSHTDLPYFGKGKKLQKSKREFNSSDVKTFTKKLNLDFDSLQFLYGLDSMEYFKFLYPKNGLYLNTFPMDVDGTEFSAYYSENGVVYQPEIIYVDQRPYYYKQTDHSIPRYSFKVAPGTHKVSLRMRDKMVTIQNVKFMPGKTILHITDRAPYSHRNVSIYDKPTKLELYEKDMLWRHLIEVNLERTESAIISQGNFQHFISNPRWGQYKYLVGPILPGKFVYSEPGKFTETIEMEHGYSYFIDSGKLKMKSYDQPFVLKQQLYNTNKNPVNNFLEHSLQEFEIQDYLEEQRLNKFKGDNVTTTSYRNGEIRLIGEHQQKIKGILLSSSTDPNFLNIYSRSSSTIRDIVPGEYKIIVLGKTKCLEIPEFTVSAKETTYINIELLQFEDYHSKLDSINSYFDQYVKDGNHRLKAVQSKSSIKSTLSTYREYSNSNGQYVTGQILDSNGQPVPGANILVRGTSNGTISDFDGYYSLFVPEGGEVQVSFIGLVTQNFAPGTSSSVDIRLQDDVSHLQEVVVTAVGISRMKKSLGYSVRTLQGKAAGVAVQRRIKIRGNTSLESGKELYIIDGVIFDTFPENLDESELLEIQVLKGSSAEALYGSRAANGITIITTKSGSAKSKLIALDGNQNQSGRIRSNFSDECMWQPKLLTNNDGVAIFKQTFPDDLTNWNISVLASSKRGQTGEATTAIKAFQPVNAKLIAPNFLINGDEISFRGKVSNYTTDSLHVISSFKVKSDTVVASGMIKDYRIDRLNLTVNQHDTLKVTYKIDYNKNIDGEERVIPIRKKGILEHEGKFFELIKDSVYQLNLAEENEVRIYHNPIRNLRNDLLNLTQYSYNCNEQMASKLLAWMYYEEASEVMKIEAKEHKRKVNKLIKKLLENRNSEGLWGWWGVSSTRWWISKHVIEALVTAKNRGYKVDFSNVKLSSDLIWELSMETDKNKILILEILKLLNNEEINYNIELSFIDFDSLSLNQKLRVTQLSLATDSIIGLSEMLSAAKSNPFKGTWWGTDVLRSIENNTVTNTALVLQILNDLDTLPDLQFQATSYLVSKKGSRGYRNTYESITTINRLMKYFLKYYQNGSPQVELITNKNYLTVNDFPYSGVLGPGNHTISNKGGGQLFFIHYKSTWNENPTKIDSLINVTTSLDSIKLGKSTTITVSIDTKHSLDYVMVSIPIPAGCSFQNKHGYVSGADHVEYLYDKVNLYFSYLPVGTKRLNFELNPRFEGSYTLNPAIAELMYFPTYFGREDLKRVSIEN